MVLKNQNMTWQLGLAEVIFQETGSTLDLSENDFSEEEDCGLHVYLGEPSSEHGALATTVETVGTLDGCIVIQRRVMSWSLTWKV